MTVCIIISEGFCLPEHNDGQSVGSQRISAKHAVHVFMAKEYKQKTNRSREQGAGSRERGADRTCQRRQHVPSNVSWLSILYEYIALHHIIVSCTPWWGGLEWRNVIHVRYKLEAGYNTSTVVPANRKRRQKGNTVSEETVNYGYWALITWLVSDCTENYRPVFSSEKAHSKEE
jgi:hypothetical protein